MGLDLSGVRRVVERLLDDDVQLWRDPDGTSDEKLDEASGELKPGARTPTLIWEGLGAIVRPGQLTTAPSLDVEVASIPAATVYQALLPLSATPVLVDDVLSVSHSARDDQLIGRRFRVAEVAVGTYAVVRVVRLEVIN